MRRPSRPPSAPTSRTGSRAARLTLLAALVLLAAGCSGGGKAGVQVSPRDGANQALAEYDTNKDGFLDAKELEACPALLAALKRIDKDGDGKLSADEIAERLTFFQQQDTQPDVSVEVTLDNRPLVGATVTLVPEKFMGPAAKSATAVTDEEGTGFFKTEGTDYVQVPCGYYKVQVSKNTQGRGGVPAKYNAQTTLGYEVSPDVGGRGSSATLRLRLKS
jgi:EF hand